MIIGEIRLENLNELDNTILLCELVIECVVEHEIIYSHEKATLAIRADLAARSPIVIAACLEFCENYLAPISQITSRVTNFDWTVINRLSGSQT